MTRIIALCDTFAMRPKTISAYLDKTRKTEVELAATLGISQAHLNEIKHGKKRPSPELALKIEKVTGIPFRALLLRNGNPTKKDGTAA